MDDIRTIVWKEWKEFFLQRGSSRKIMMISWLLPIVLLGIVIPSRAGPGYVSSPLSLIAPALMPLLFIMALMADSFAGERERHTLETLLATRLDDQSILLGKIMAGVLYAWAVLIVTLALAAGTNNLVYERGHFRMFPTDYLIAVLIFDFLLVVLLSSIGVFVSLRASTVRQALQTLNLGLVVVIWGGFFGFRALPESWQLAVIRVFIGKTFFQTEIIVGIALITLDIVLLGAARARFRRDRLILD
jgi:ABC-2 type transport system permease protein